jgi:oxygen-independent coproporphyrinogen-3 oxidase
MNKGLYVHIPFCGAICHYCDFVKFIYQKEWVSPYLKRLKEDLAFFNVPTKLNTIYIGGGTPTVLSKEELKELLALLKPYTKHVTEYTIEANVESITKEKLELMKEFGVNRLSIGVQSTNDERLVSLNRLHSYIDIKKAIKLVKEVGFTNFSVDLIYGLPKQSKDELRQDIANILKLEPPHIATYDLQIETNTIAYINKWPKISDEESREMYEIILKALRKAGYKRYEVSNFAKPTFESVHNKLYWRNDNYYAIGLGASGYINNKRYIIKGGLKNYLQGSPKIEEDTITKEMYIEEYLMLNLRLEDGFLLDDFNKKTGLDFKKAFAVPLEKLHKMGLIYIDDYRFSLTDEGILLLDSVILTLIS